MKVIILTYNEELNLPKCLEALQALKAEVLIVDSFSTDRTVEIALNFGCQVVQNKFENHTQQWIFALNQVVDEDEWILALDADQVLSEDLVDEILEQSAEDVGVNGYYICRKNIFLGKWIKHGGYYPKYLLKYFKKKSMYMDPNEKMDHHFYVQGATSKFRHDLIEENLKETFEFWKEKHKRYAVLQAEEEFHGKYLQHANAFGNQDQRRVWLKKIWNQLPLFIRPILYFFLRMFFQLGFLDGRIGIKFHFYQAFWYRWKVDQHLKKLRLQKLDTGARIRFIVGFIGLSLLFYYGHLWLIGISSPGGGYYSPFVHDYLYYVQAWRDLLIYSSVKVLNWLGHPSVQHDDYFRIVNGIRVNVGYSCIGFGVYGVYAALLLSYPLKNIFRLRWLIYGFIILNMINIMRIVAVGFFYNNYRGLQIDHHLIFNIIAYGLIFLFMKQIFKQSRHVHSRS